MCLTQTYRIFTLHNDKIENGNHNMIPEYQCVAGQLYDLFEWQKELGAQH